MIAYIYQITGSSVFFTLKKWTELAKLECSRLKQTKLDQHGLKQTEVYQMNLIGPNGQNQTKWAELDRNRFNQTKMDQREPNGPNQTKVD